MYALKRLPLTTSAVALFSAYTVVLVTVKKIKTYFARKICEQEPYLLPDVQHEILKHLLRDINIQTFYASSHPVFDLSLVCKEWFKYISYNEIWTEILEKEIANSRRIEDLGETDEHISDSIERLVGSKGVVSPKLLYYIYRRRIDNQYHGQRPRPLLTKLTPDLKSIKNSKKLWTPWLNHNIFKAPETVCKWLYTAMRYPRWLFPLLFEAYDPNKKYGIYSDQHNLGYVQKILSVLSTCLSILPWIDNAILNSTGLYNDATSGKYFSLLVKNSWSLTAQIQSVSFLLWMQLFDDLYDSPKLLIVRSVLLISTFLLDRGLLPFIASAAVLALGYFLVLIGVHKKTFAKIGNIGTALFMLLVASPLVYFYRGLLVLGGAAFVAVVMDLARRDKVEYSEQKVKYSGIYLALAFGTIGWALL